MNLVCFCPCLKVGCHWLEWSRENVIFLTPTVHGEPRKEHFSLLVSAVERAESFPAINGGVLGSGSPRQTRKWH